MLSVKLVRSLVLGETIINNPCYFNHHNNDNDAHNKHTHDEYDADDDDITTQIQLNNNKKPTKISSKTYQKAKKKMPLLLFTPTKELISDTFRLATIARDIGMDFYPSPSLSHLFFSWPSPTTSPAPRPRGAESGECRMYTTLPLENRSESRKSTIYATLPFDNRYVISTTRLTGQVSGEGMMYATLPPVSPISTISSNNNRPSISSITSTSTTTCSSSTSTIQSNDGVPLPFPTLSTTSSISLLRYFVSLSKGLFKLVFVGIDANSRFNYYANCNYGGNLRHGFDFEKGVKLISRVSGKVVDSMDVFSRVLAGNGWALFRSPENKKKSVVGSEEEGLDLVFMFRKQDFNRVRVRGEKMINGGGCGGGGGGGECRVRELRLPTLDFKGGVPLRILQYILLMTDDVFYLA